MKDKRLEVKLSVRGDGSLSRNSNRSSTRSNRSNVSSNNGLPVSEFFAIDRFSAPQNRSFNILDKYRRQPSQHGYPGQSLQVLNQYQRPNNGYEVRERSNPYIDNVEFRDPRLHDPRDQFVNRPNQPPYQPVYNDPSIFVHGTLPRMSNRSVQRDYSNYSNNHYTLPARPGLRRVRISEMEPTVYDYGM